MQLYNSALTHFPRSSHKVTITLLTRSERRNSSDAPKAGLTHQSATSPNTGPVRDSSANMPAFSCYEASSIRPVYFTSTAEISIRRPDGLERSVPVHVVRETKTKPPVSPNGDSFLCGDSDVIEDLMDHLRNGRDECKQLLRDQTHRICREDNEREFGNSSEDDTVSQSPVRSKGWSLREEEVVPLRGDRRADLILDDVKDLSHGVPAPGEKRGFELSVLQDSPPQKHPDTGNKVTRYLAEVEKQNKYLQGEHKYRYHIIPDGNCLYRAVCKATFGDQARHGELREQTVHHIADHLEEFNPIIEGDVGEFLINAAQDGAWAGYPELLAMSQMLDVNMHLTTGGSLESPTVSTMVHYLGEEDVSKVSVWLSWLSNGHYDVLLDQSLQNPEHEEWCRLSQVQRKRDEELAKSMAASLSKMYIEQNGSA
ncbi:OTU domain-containing protein 1 [Pseudochaenichthys georgianus]|uniref:OTU domain-containing protein 1 n=1 Tax=Pseudochaenichthys georgianus TaxID=52239 RepID=UPI00146BCC93|nr:OTU domain-containing protein 1 [Pseudochaenichthys georgianus]